MPVALFDIYFSKATSHSVSLQSRLPGAHSLTAMWALPWASPRPSVQPSTAPSSVALGAPLSPRKCSYPPSSSDFPFPTSSYLLMFPWILSSVLFSLHTMNAGSHSSIILTTLISWWYSAIFPELQTQTCICLLNISGINKPQAVSQTCPALFSAFVNGTLSTQSSRPETRIAWPFSSL